MSNTSWSVYNFRLEIIRFFLRKGIRVVVVAPKDNFSSKLISEGIDFEELHLNNYGTNPFSELKTLFQLIRIFKKTKPDLVFHYTIKPNIYGSIASYITKTKSYIAVTGLGQLFKFKNQIIQSLTLKLYKFACSNSEQVWFLNDNDRDVFLYKNLVSLEKTKILPSEGINTNWFKPIQDKKTSNTTTFLFAGRLLWEKGLQEFVDSAKIISKERDDVSFKILGFIDQNNPGCVSFSKIKEWQSKGIIEYLGETMDIRPFLEKCDCFIFPSYYREGISRVLLEAASMETPIITTKNVGCKDVIINGKTGFLVESKNVLDLVTTIHRFLGYSHQDRMVMGKLSRKHIVDNFDQTKINKIYWHTVAKHLQVDMNKLLHESK